ncbi:MAG: hypothetical protein WC686_03070 [Candidatus Shapirobacteria bacterium]|jgi:hypothetical protein
MRVKKVLQKKLEKIILPERMISFFQWVSKDIEKKEEYTQVESDDMIQDQFNVGGLTKEGSGVYQFTYYPDEHSKIDYTWSLTLTAKQIKQIAEGQIKTLNLWSCQQDGCQNKSMDQSDSCYHHDYYDDGTPDPSKITAEELERLVSEKRKLFELWEKQKP